MKMPLSAVGMIAAHLYLEKVEASDMLPRDLKRLGYGTKQTFGELIADEAARDAWMIAAAVETIGQELQSEAFK